MTLQTILKILFLHLVIFHVFAETHYLWEFLWSPCQFLMADHAGIFTLISCHSLNPTIVDFPMPMTDFTVNRCMTAILPITILRFMTIFTKRRPQMHQGKIHLLFYIVAPIVPIITKRFRNQE